MFKVSWEDEYSQGAKLSVNYNDDHIISTSILQRTPGSNITNRRKAASSDVFQTTPDEGPTINRMSD